MSRHWTANNELLILNYRVHYLNIASIYILNVGHSFSPSLFQFTHSEIDSNGITPFRARIPREAISAKLIHTESLHLDGKHIDRVEIIKKIETLCIL